MNNTNLVENKIAQIRTSLSLLQAELAALESSYLSTLRSLETAAQAAAKDDLTGLLRRNTFSEKFQRALKGFGGFQADGSFRTISVIACDIDHFKRVNDTYGHAAGDEVIRQAADLLRTLAGPDAIIGRMGGEEFAIVLECSREDALSLAEAIRQTASESVRRIPFTLSLGVATADSGHPEYFKEEVLLQAADQALYLAKNGGRNQVQLAA